MRRTIVLALMFFCSLANAKDFGIVGTTYSIAEPHTLNYIQSKLKEMEASGEIAEHQQRIAKKAKAGIRRPKAIALGRATKERVHYFNPSIALPDDLRDHKNRTVLRKGLTGNPLMIYQLPEPLLFFDADDEAQLEWAIEQGRAMWILTRGEPLTLMEQRKHPVYFDQGGYYVKKLNITQVPARVEQQGFELKITEVRL